MQPASPTMMTPAPGPSVTLGTVSAVRRGFDRSVSVRNPKIKLGSKLIDHRPNKLKGVSSEVLVYLVG
jgi:hypothetical protein